MYQHMMEFGLCFPLDPFIMCLLSAYNICLDQLCAKSIRHIIGYLLVCHFKSWSPSLRSFHEMHFLKPLRADKIAKRWWTINNRLGYLTVFSSVPYLNNWKDLWYVVRLPAAPGHPYLFTAPLRFRRTDPDIARFPELTVGPHDRIIVRGCASEKPDKVTCPKKWLPHCHYMQNERVLALGGLRHKFSVGKCLG